MSNLFFNPNDLEDCKQSDNQIATNTSSIKDTPQQHHQHPFRYQLKHSPEILSFDDLAKKIRSELPCELNDSKEI